MGEGQHAFKDAQWNRSLEHYGKAVRMERQAWLILQVPSSDMFETTSRIIKRKDILTNATARMNFEDIMQVK